MSCCGIAGSSWLSPKTPKFITNVAACSFRPMDNISSAYIATTPLRRSLLTAGGGTTRNVADRSVQHRKSSSIGWKRMLFPVDNIKEVDKYYDLLIILETALTMMSGGEAVYLL
ncbi:putative protein isoform X1 [Capsicum annuum]